MKKWIQSSIGLAIFFLTACRSTAIPTPTHVPTATPLPVTSPAYEVAAAFLDAWALNDYETMYAHCTAEAQKNTSLEEFKRIYDEITQESTLLSVHPALVAVLENGTVAQAAFSAEMRTSFVGTFTIENALPLVWESDRWAIDWSKTCIFRELETENLHIHHKVYKCHGGDDTLDNLMFMHDVCHRQLHTQSKDEAETGGLVERPLMKA